MSLKGLQKAVREGHVDTVRDLLAAGADVLKGDSNFKATALLWACDNLDLVQSLLEADADIDLKDIYGWNALYCALQEGRIDLFQSLLAAGADIDGESHRGWTALHRASERGNLTVLQSLLWRGANMHKRVNEGVNRGQTALEIASRKGHIVAVRILEAALAEEKP